MCELKYLRSDLCGLFGIDCADVLVVFQRVLPVLLLCTHVFLQQAQHLTSLVVAVLCGVNGIFTLMDALVKQKRCPAFFINTSSYFVPVTLAELYDM